jgi:uncharacterized protein YjbJ (UPF0337 family)
MNWERIAGRWQQAKGLARQQWGRVTGNYVGVVAGLRERSLGKARAVHGVTQEAHEQQLAEWRERQHKVDPIHK